MEMRTLQLFFFSYHRRTEAAAACVPTDLRVIFARRRRAHRRKRCLVTHDKAFLWNKPFFRNEEHLRTFTAIIS